jgi:hypothetical protein
MAIYGLIRKIGWDYDTFFHTLKLKNANRLLQKKMQAISDMGILEHYDLEKHFAHESLSEKDDQVIVKSSLVDRMLFLRKCFSLDELQEDSFLDLGDPSGIFLQSIGQLGISYNISREAVQNCRSNGLEAIQGDIACLPFKEQTVDHVFLFQTLEHLPDPIAMLNKIGTINVTSLTISIPCVSQTVIHRHNYDPTRRIYEHHIFEFSDSDIQKVITHTPYKIERMEHAVLFDEKMGGLVERVGTFIYTVFMKRPNMNPEYYPVANDMFYGAFKQFTMIHLRKT